MGQYTVGVPPLLMLIRKSKDLYLLKCANTGFGTFDRVWISLLHKAQTKDILYQLRTLGTYCECTLTISPFFLCFISQQYHIIQIIPNIHMAHTQQTTIIPIKHNHYPQTTIISIKHKPTTNNPTNQPQNIIQIQIHTIPSSPAIFDPNIQIKLQQTNHPIITNPSNYISHSNVRQMLFPFEFLGISCSSLTSTDKLRNSQILFLHTFLAFFNNFLYHFQCSYFLFYFILFYFIFFRDANYLPLL